MKYLNLGGRKFPRHQKLMMIRIRGDGNCGFYCLLTFLYAVGILEFPTLQFVKKGVNPLTHVMHLRELLAVYSRVYEELFTESQYVIDNVRPCVSKEDVKAEYTQVIWDLYNDDMDYEFYDLLKLPPEKYDESGFMDCEFVGRVIAKFFQIKMVCATESQVTIYDGTDPKESLKITTIDINDFVKEKVGFETFMIAMDNKHYNLFLLEEYVRDAQKYKIRKQS